METRDEVITVIKPISRWEVLNVRQMFAFRDLLTALGSRDVKLRYRQTALGVVWVILQPLLAAGIFSFVFGTIAGLKAPAGIPYFIFSYAGMLGWNLFSSTWSKAASSLIQNSALVSKVYFPKILVPLSSMFSSLVDFAVAFAMFLILLPIFHVPITLQFALFPVWIALLLMMSLGLGLYCAALMVTYRDVQYVVPVFINFLLFGTPINFSMDNVPHSLKWFVEINPLTGLFEGLRWSLVGHGQLSPGPLAYSITMSVLIFLAGALLFGKVERRFADVI